MATVGKIVERDGRKLYLLNQKVIAKGKVDSYKVTGRKGAGGFGAIYMVRRKSDDLPAVLKMSTDIKKKAFGGERIRREAWIMRQCSIRSDLIPQVLDEGEINGRPFFVMENLIPLEWSSNGDEKFGLPDTEDRRMAFFMLLIESVKAIHEAGFVHCDINIKSGLYCLCKTACSNVHVVSVIIPRPSHNIDKWCELHCFKTLAAKKQNIHGIHQQ